MGWSFNINPYQTKAEFRAECVALCNYECENNVYKSIMHRTVGNHLWVARESTEKATGKKESWVDLFLLAKDRDGWGYKGISEQMGPCEVDCPESVIKAAGSAPECDYAKEWRKKVEAFHIAKKAQKEAQKNVKVGSIVTLRNAKPSKYRIIESDGGKFYGEVAETGHGYYRIPKSRIVEVEN